MDTGRGDCAGPIGVVMGTTPPIKFGVPNMLGPEGNGAETLYTGNGACAGCSRKDGCAGIAGGGGGK